MSEDTPVPADPFDEPRVDESLPFKRELAQLLNKYSFENGSNTPDFLLADYLFRQLQALDALMLRRRYWCGENDKLAGGGTGPAPQEKP